MAEERHKMVAQDWIMGERDHELFQRELNSFVPDVIFDAHAHWYRADHIPARARPPLIQSGPPIAGSHAFDEAIGELIPGRHTEGLFFPYPHQELDISAANFFLREELRGRPSSRGQMLVTPQDDPEDMRATVRAAGFVGLKCYHVYAASHPTFEALIEDFLPEGQVRVAHEEGLSITLHLVRSRALADPANQETIRRYCQSYPNMRLILAHAARGFNPHHTMAGIHALRGLSNVWFDTSVVTDAGAMESIINVMGHQRLLYGSDFPVSHLRGRCVAIGDNFLWISSDNTQLQAAYGHIDLALVGHEALRALKVAAMATRLTDTQIEDIFHHNSMTLYALE